MKLLSQQQIRILDLDQKQEFRFVIAKVTAKQFQNLSYAPIPASKLPVMLPRGRNKARRVENDRWLLKLCGSCDESYANMKVGRPLLERSLNV